MAAPNKAQVDVAEKAVKAKVSNLLKHISSKSIQVQFFKGNHTKATFTSMYLSLKVSLRLAKSKLVEFPAMD